MSKHSTMYDLRILQAEWVGSMNYVVTAVCKCGTVLSQKGTSSDVVWVVMTSKLASHVADS